MPAPGVPAADPRTFQADAVPLVPKKLVTRLKVIPFHRAIIGWDGTGEGMDRARAADIRIPLDLPSVFQTVTRDQTV